MRKNGNSFHTADNRNCKDNAVMSEKNERTACADVYFDAFRYTDGSVSGSDERGVRHKRVVFIAHNKRDIAFKICKCG